MRASSDYPQLIQSLKAEIHQLKSQLQPQSPNSIPPSLQSQLTAQANLVNSLKHRLGTMRLAASVRQKEQGIQVRDTAAFAVKRLETQIKSVKKANRSAEENWEQISFLEKRNSVLRKQLEQAEKERRRVTQPSKGVSKGELETAKRGLEELQEQVCALRRKVTVLEGRAKHTEAVIVLTERLQQEKDSLIAQLQSTCRLLQTRESQCLELETACDGLRVPLRRKPPRPPLQPSDSSNRGQSTTRTVTKSQSWQGFPTTKPVGLATRIVLLNRGALPSSESLASYI